MNSKCLLVCGVALAAAAVAVYKIFLSSGSRVAPKREFSILKKDQKQDHSWRLVTYNVLADGPGLALSEKHSYCPKELRIWEGKNGRWELLRTELDHYRQSNVSIFCLQEIVTPHFHQNFKPSFAEWGYEAVHVREVLANKKNPDKKEKKQHEEPQAEELEEAFPKVEDIFGVATFIRKDEWEILDVDAVLYRDMIKDGCHTGRLRQRLRTLNDACLMTFLRHKKSNAEVLVVNVHLFWNPQWPHAKVIQAEMTCKAARDFLARIRPGKSIPIILAGDFNSVKEMQPDFLPERQKEWIPEFKNLSTSHQQSAVYSLFTSGQLESDHPEHPDTFGSAEPSQKFPTKKSKKKGICGVLTTELNLINAYESARGGTRLPFTTKTTGFTQAIDYIWFTRNQQLEMTGTLDMPYRGNGVDFSYIPSREWASDHLALGSEFIFKS